MTWEELCERAKELGFERFDVPGSNSKAEEITIPGMCKEEVYFNQFGDVFISKLNPDQMYQIMETIR